MEAKLYNFPDQYAVGEEGEKALDLFFSTVGRFKIDNVPMVLQHKGVDRFFTSARGGVATVEYKTDYKAADTGNAFLETEHLYDNGERKAGWVLSSVSQILIYFVPQLEIAWMVNMLSLKTEVRKLLGTNIRRGKVYNKGKETTGILLPIERLKPLSFAERNITIKKGVQSGTERTGTK